MTPHRCPVCGGNGIKDRGFYASTTGRWADAGTATVPCRSCEGTGVVWDGRRKGYDLLPPFGRPLPKGVPS